MIPVVDSDEYVQRLLGAWRPGAEKIFAFYDHRLGVIGTDPRLILMPWDDHLVHRGDGVFESMKYIGRRIYQLDAHIRRMKRSSSAIYLAPPIPWEQVREAVIETARAGGEDNGMIRILLGRGPGGFGIDPIECPVPSLYIAAYRFKAKPEEAFEKGVTAFRTSIPAKQSWLATIKCIDYLPNVLMRRETLEKGYDYPFCFNEKNLLAEGATENVVIVDKTDTIVVPELTNCLAGTTMLRATELIAQEFPMRYDHISENDILEAKEVIIIGTTTDAISVVRYNDKPIHDVRPGPVSKRMRELLKADLKENGVPF